MPDTWMIDNGLNPFDSSDASRDDDGFTSLHQYKFGSDLNVFDGDEDKNGVPHSIDAKRGMVLPTWYLLSHKMHIR